MYFEIYRDKRSEWRWRFVSNNAKTLADSGEGYVNRSDCEAAIALLKLGASGAPIKHV